MKEKLCTTCWKPLFQRVWWYTYCDYCKYSTRELFKDWYDIASEERDKKHWKKESGNKLSYELDWDFIEAMAKRMDQNKGKYPPYNRQKPMDIESLKQALLRHTIEVMKGNYTDIEDYDHLQAISLNAMFIYYQLKNNVTTPRSNTTHE